MKHIALDIGNVLCHVNMNDFIVDISSTFDIPIDAANRFLRSFQQIHDLGLTTMEHQLRHHFGCKSEATLKRIIDKWNNAIYPDLGMINMLSELQNNGIEIALLSNIGAEHVELLSAKLHPILDKSTKHFSCFVGARKPTLLYYQSFLIQYPHFAGCLYIDDLQENLNASLQFGFKTLRFALDEADAATKIMAIAKLMQETP